MIPLQLNQPILIISPNFPNPYPTFAYQEWSFTAPPDSIIQITVVSHSTEQGYDYVNIGSGLDSADRDTLIAIVDGDVLPDTVFVSEANEMWLYFVSDFSFELTGFQYRIVALDTPEEIEVRQ